MCHVQRRRVRRRLIRRFEVAASEDRRHGVFRGTVRHSDTPAGCPMRWRLSTPVRCAFRAGPEGGSRVDPIITDKYYYR